MMSMLAHASLGDSSTFWLMLVVNQNRYGFLIKFRLATDMYVWWVMSVFSLFFVVQVLYFNFMLDTLDFVCTQFIGIVGRLVLSLSHSMALSPFQFLLVAVFQLDYYICLASNFVAQQASCEDNTIGG